MKLNFLNRALFLFLDFVFIKIFGEKKGEQFSESIKKKPSNAYYASIFIILSSLIYTFRGNVVDFFSSEPTIEFNSKSDNTLKVLVLPFNKYVSGGTQYDIEKTIKNSIKNLKETDSLPISILYDSLSKPPSNKEEAVLILNRKKIKPDIIIYGDYDSYKDNYRINIISEFDKNSISLPFKINNILPEYFTSQFKNGLSVPDFLSFEALSNEKAYIYYLLSLSAIKIHNYKNAIKYLDKTNEALKSMNTDLQYNNKGLSYYYLSILLKEFEKPTCNSFQSLQLSEKVINLYPKNIYGRLTRLYYYFSIHNLEKAFYDSEYLLLHADDENVIYVTLLSRILLDIIMDNYSAFENDLLKIENLEKQNKKLPHLSVLISNSIKGNFGENNEFIVNQTDLPSDIKQLVSYYSHLLNGENQLALDILPKLRKSKQFNDFTNIIINRNPKLIDSVKSDYRIFIYPFILNKKAVLPNYVNTKYFSLLSKTLKEIEFIKEQNTDLAIKYYELSNQYRKIGYSIISNYYEYQALKMKPKLITNYSIIGYNQTMKDSLKNIFDDCEKQKQNNEIEYCLGSIFYNLSNHSENTNYYNICIEHFEKALNSTKNDEYRKYLLEKLCGLEIDSNKQILYIKQLIEYNPNIVNNYYNISNYYKIIGDYYNANVYLKKAVSIMNEHNISHKHKYYQKVLNELKHINNLIKNNT